MMCSGGPGPLLVGLDEGFEDLGDFALVGQVVVGDHLGAQALQAHVPQRMYN